MKKTLVVLQALKMCPGYGATSVKFLGHIISASFLKPDDKKVAAVRNWPSPAQLQCPTFDDFCGLPTI